MPKLIMLVVSLLVVGLMIRTYLRPSAGPSPTEQLKHVQEEVVRLEKQGQVRAQLMEQQRADEARQGAAE